MQTTVRTCVIGGDGFIGQYLCDALLATGRDVLVLGRKSTPSQHFININKTNKLKNNLTYLSLDVSAVHALRQALLQCDEVIDLAYATVPQTSFTDPMFDLQSNLPRVVALMEELKTMPHLRCFMVVSSGGTVYGHPQRLPISEYADTEPVSPYGITKLTIERYALMYHRLHGLPVVVVRPANAYGCGQQPFAGQGFVATAMGNVLHNKPTTVFGAAGTVRDYVHVKDVALGMLAALTHGKGGDIFNIGSGVGRTNLEVLGLMRPLLEKSNHTIVIDHAPERKFDVRANVLNFGRLLSCSGWLPQVDIEIGLAEMWIDFLLKYKDHSKK